MMLKGLGGPISDIRAHVEYRAKAEFGRPPNQERFAIDGSMVRDPIELSGQTAGVKRNATHIGVAALMAVIPPEAFRTVIVKPA
jgi:hypothetical protein